MSVIRTKDAKQNLKTKRKNLDAHIRRTKVLLKEAQRKNQDYIHLLHESLAAKMRSHFMHILHHIMHGKTEREVAEKYGLRFYNHFHMWYRLKAAGERHKILQHPIPIAYYIKQEFPEFWLEEREDDVVL